MTDGERGKGPTVSVEGQQALLDKDTFPGPRVGRQASGWTESNTPIQRGTEAEPTWQTLNKHREQADSHDSKNHNWPFSSG
jgi:hypothetical protein